MQSDGKIKCNETKKDLTGNWKEPISKDEKKAEMFFAEIIEYARKHNTTKEELHKMKVKLAKKYGISRLPGDSEILERVPKEEKENFEFLRTKPVRTLSGVAVVAVMTSPHDCPHGKCMYCPGGVNFGSPQSYTGKEPAALRAVNYNYDPYLMTKGRLEQLRICGHPIDKVDLIIMGGTFTARDLDYQEWFVKRCFDAMNGLDSKYLEDAHKLNESAESRCIGLTIESRPDWLREPQVDRCLKLGATRIEMGVQTVFDDILKKVERGHTVDAVVEATRLVKDSGLKVGYHMMPGLPGMTMEKDVEGFRTIFTDERFKPDMIKIYPTLVLKGTKLYDDWKNGRYVPYTDEEGIELIARIKKIVPKWVRIQRIERDIPVPLIDAGIKKSNLREYAEARLKDEGLKCKCIRCREAGHRFQDGLEPENIELTTTKYEASFGREHFIAFEDNAPERDILVGYLRLRIPSKFANRIERPEITPDTGLIREVKVFGQMLSFGVRTQKDFQHKGFGQRLIKEAEEQARECGMKKVAITAGVGTRNYYRKFGYELEGPYMIKLLN